jgi:hypothetical protein
MTETSIQKLSDYKLDPRGQIAEGLLYTHWCRIRRWKNLIGRGV